ncbi:YdaS family helix-turn-helix protein [Serratia sp. IR-2025]|uniref:YdaS family helix-turn-helix protein n=1 Tax=Serratia marcescens TaxID=615 RepID=UPI0015D7D5D8|nr:YdaS family helix-turn-helix protein [Serratia marcescens]MBH2794532.1 helix-turn-helix domain-containing protein [Serratia marcescens]MBN3986656.1 helix-turn-helix domain-containing protein [Serratia marcescens]MCX2172747.1 helix-turn-helix domain-containing protein [Serratia marcescens]MCX2176026.1 helix-turn-helix domain-containing protein [Serratia marcescens]QLJ60106.1 helix-turn-helix domain-containing protein [Serratia marcescens]
MDGINSVIQKAISIAGSQVELAEKVGVDQSSVSKWLNGGGIKSKYIPSIVSATNGQVTTTEILSSLQEKPTENLSDENVTAPAA